MQKKQPTPLANTSLFPEPIWYWLSRKPFYVLLLLPFGIGCLPLIAQTGCSECEVTLPDSLATDTFYLQSFPDGQYRAAYQHSLNFRLPTNTSQVLYLVPSLPGNVGIGAIRIQSIQNLPAGISWQPSQNNYDLPEKRDGCIQLCGTPLQYGHFKVAITVEAKIAVLNQSATFERDLYIAPPVANNDGFLMENNIACGSSEVIFTNNHPSEGQSGFRYEWHFGENRTSYEENPTPQLFNQPGIYPVSYQAVIDTSDYTLASVQVSQVGCDDFIGKPDIFIQIKDEQDSIVFKSNAVNNAEIPLLIPVNITLAENDYLLEIIDKDNGLSGSDDICASIVINQESADTVMDDNAIATLEIFHPIDTIQSSDTVQIFPLPNQPAITYDTNFLFCENDTLLLQIADADTSWQYHWFSQGDLLTNHTTLPVTQSGTFLVRVTDHNGCQSYSDSLSFNPLPAPAIPILKQENNLLSIFDTNALPDEFELNWYQEGNLLEHSQIDLCIEETGMYGVAVTDLNYGCSNFYETVFSYQSGDVCSTPAENEPLIVEKPRVYPNPATDYMIVEWTTNSHQLQLLQLYNTWGKLILSKHLSPASGDLITLDISHLPKGIYWLQGVSESKKHFAQKVVVQ